MRASCIVPHLAVTAGQQLLHLTSKHAMKSSAQEPLSCLMINGCVHRAQHFALHFPFPLHSKCAAQVRGPQLPVVAERWKAAHDISQSSCRVEEGGEGGGSGSVGEATRVLACKGARLSARRSGARTCAWTWAPPSTPPSTSARCPHPASPAHWWPCWPAALSPGLFHGFT